MVCCAKVGAHAPVMACNNDTTTPSLLFLVYTVLNGETSLFDGILENGGILVVTDTTQIDNRIGWENVLGATSGVLSCTAGNEFCIVVV